jgi:hypothetical protein
MTYVFSINNVCSIRRLYRDILIGRERQSLSPNLQLYRDYQVSTEVYEHNLM